MMKKSIARHIELGRLGEDAALALLRSKQMTLLYRNYKTESGEADLVMRDGIVLVFVEVKTLYRSGRFSPRANLKIAQIRRNYRAAYRYLRSLGHPEVPCRFDLIEVIRNKKRVSFIRHHEGYLADVLSEKGGRPWL